MGIIKKCMDGIWLYKRLKLPKESRTIKNLKKKLKIYLLMLSQILISEYFLSPLNKILVTLARVTGV